MSMSFGRNTMPNAICSFTRQEFITMATFIAHAHRDFRHPYLLHGEELHGTDASDIFLGSAGTDTIYAGGGSDDVNGGSGDDTIYAQAFGSSIYGAWGNDAVHAGDGNDRINYGQTTSNVALFGDNGDDVIYSGSGNDKIYGGAGNDWIFGGNGNDTIYGDGTAGAGNDIIYGWNGNDYIFGGDGNDEIWGGRDVDYLTGGGGADTFKFNAGDSGLHWADADVIYDFRPSFDRGFQNDTIDIVGTEKGTSSNFGHINGPLNTSNDADYVAVYEHALKFADSEMQFHTNLKYEFVTDGHNGFLFVDTNGDHHPDMGIELRGVTDMHYWNVV
jgi:Ca2+-binding RTX toxin-like protein